MERKVINTKKAPTAVGPYVQAVQKGNMLYVSGQLGLEPETGSLPEGVEAQAEQSLKNIAAILNEADFAKGDIVKTTVFLSDMNHFGAVNEIYKAFFGETKPARSCVEVAKLPKDGLVEIEVVAIK